MSLQGHAGGVLCCAFNHADGYSLVTGSMDHTVKYWELRKQLCLFTIPAHTHLVSDVKFSPIDGSYIVSSSFDHTVKYWSSRNFQLLHVNRSEEKVMRVDISADEKYIATGNFDRTWKLLSII